MGYSPERKAAVLKRMLPPNNMAIRQLSKEEGISEGTLHAWRSQARSNMRTLAKSIGIDVIHSWELPLPPDPPQGILRFDED